jgi:hypothetical protein
LLEGEDAVAYELLLARFRAAVQPTDVIDEMYIAGRVVAMGGATVAPLEVCSNSSAEI